MRHEMHFRARTLCASGRKKRVKTFDISLGVFFSQFNEIIFCTNGLTWKNTCLSVRSGIFLSIYIYHCVYGYHSISQLMVNCWFGLVVWDSMGYTQELNFWSNCHRCHLFPLQKFRSWNWSVLRTPIFSYALMELDDFPPPKKSRG